MIHSSTWNRKSIRGKLSQIDKDSEKMSTIKLGRENGVLVTGWVGGEVNRGSCGESWSQGYWLMKRSERPTGEGESVAMWLSNPASKIAIYDTNAFAWGSKFDKAAHSDSSTFEGIASIFGDSDISRQVFPVFSMRDYGCMLRRCPDYSKEFSQEPSRHVNSSVSCFVESVTIITYSCRSIAAYFLLCAIWRFPSARFSTESKEVVNLTVMNAIGNQKKICKLPPNAILSGKNRRSKVPPQRGENFIYVWMWQSRQTEAKKNSRQSRFSSWKFILLRKKCIVIIDRWKTALKPHSMESRNPDLDCLYFAKGLVASPSNWQSTLNRIAAKSCMRRIPGLGGWRNRCSVEMLQQKCLLYPIKGRSFLSPTRVLPSCNSESPSEYAS